MLSRVIRCLSFILMLTALAGAAVSAGAASDIGEPAKLEAVLTNGKKVDIGQWKGKVVMVNFWATWYAARRQLTSLTSAAWSR